MVSEIDEPERSAGGKAAGGQVRLGLSIRMVRELLVADASEQLRHEADATRAASLLTATVTPLRLTGGAILRREIGSNRLACLALRDLPARVGEVLDRTPEPDSSGSLNGYALARRALSERCVFLIDPTSIDPLMSALRESGLGSCSVAVVPLYDLGEPVGVLILAGPGESLQAPTMRALSGALHLLAVLLSPSRGHLASLGRLGDDQHGRASESEAHALEIEELMLRLREAEEGSEIAEQRLDRDGVTLRAELETSRAQIGDLEAKLARESVELARHRDEEEALAALRQACSERDQKIRVLEAALETAVVSAQLKALEPTEPEAIQLDVSEEEPNLIDLAGEAEASLDDLAGDSVEAVVAAANQEDEPPEPTPISFAVLHLDSQRDARSAAANAAGNAGAILWCGEDGAPKSDAAVMAVNLFDPQLRRAAELATSFAGPLRTIVYCADLETGQGFTIGAGELLCRPLDPRIALEQLGRSVPGKLTSVVIVSSHLRELARLREGLSSAGVSNSVACDSRQALELLEIVRRPDAFVLDLAPDSGEGLALAAQLRTVPSLAKIPLALLLPPEIDPVRLRAAAVRVVADETPPSDQLEKLIRHELEVLARRPERPRYRPIGS